MRISAGNPIGKHRRMASHSLPLASSTKPSRGSRAVAPPETGARRKGQYTFSERSLHGRIAHAIGLRIVKGELRPDTPLPSEAVWSEQLGISRTELRQAV